jgi:hypothetical protein
LREARRSGRKPSISHRIKEAIITEATRPPQRVYAMVFAQDGAGQRGLGQHGAEILESQ